MKSLIVNGHGTKFRVTSKSGKDTSNFKILTDKGTKKVEVKDEVEVNFNDAA